MHQWACYSCDFVHNIQECNNTAICQQGQVSQVNTIYLESSCKLHYLESGCKFHLSSARLLTPFILIQVAIYIYLPKMKIWSTVCKIDIIYLLGKFIHGQIIASRVHSTILGMLRSGNNQFIIGTRVSNGVYPRTREDYPYQYLLYQLIFFSLHYFLLISLVYHYFSVQQQWSGVFSVTIKIRFKVSKMKTNKQKKNPSIPDGLLTIALLLKGFLKNRSFDIKYTMTQQG